MKPVMFSTLCAAFLSALCVGFLVGVGVGWYDSSQTLAMQWGDGKYGASFYGAEVYVKPSGKGYSVRGRVQIGPGNPYFHDCGELGWVSNHGEAVKRWGRITWKEEGLYIGRGDADDYFLPRKTIESHR
jgi:hypothetical protein